MSLRARLLVGMAVIGIVLAVVAIAVARTTEAHLIDQVDAELRDAPLRLGSGPGPGGPNRPGSGPGDYSSYFVGYVDDGEVVTLATPTLTDDELPLPTLTAEQVETSAARHEPFTVGSDGSDLRYRALGRNDGRFGALAVLATPIDDVDDAINRLVALEVTATAVVLAVLGLVTWWVIRLGVRPVKRMTATASAIAAGDLSHRVPDVAPGTEAGELGIALNMMLGRIEEAFDERTRSEARLRQFVADASHELRTPVTTIRGYAELYRRGALDESTELDEAMRRTEQEAVRMGTLVDDLLHLARLDQGRPLERERVELTGIAEDAVRDARAVDPDRPITSTTNGPVVIAGDEARLRQVIANVVGNALVHTPAGTPIDVAVRQTDGTAVVEITDHGPGMPAEVATRAFERFYRADESRSRHRGGSGLGLSIVSATVAAHGGSVALDSAPGRGTTVRIELPISFSG
jgi:two-component system OmpR family sensor kinase